MNYTLKDLLDVPKLQELLDSLDEVHSLPSAIIDMEGNILTATAWQDICIKFHRVNPNTLKKCIESDLHIGTELAENMSHVVYSCPMGLVDTATPIVIEGKHLGNVFTGQLFMGPPDESYFKEQARQYGFDEDEYLVAMRKVPIFSEEQLHKNLAFIAKLAQMLAVQGLQAKRQREALQALQKSEEFIRSIIASSNDCIKVLDLEGHLLSLSEGGQKLLEIEELQPFIGLSWLDFWKEDKEGAQHVIAKAANGEVGIFHGYCPTVKGTPKWWEVVVSPIMGADNTVENLLAVSRDITERKRIEKEREQYFSFFFTSEDVMVIADPNGCFKRINPACLKMLGYSQEELLSKPFIDFVHPDDRQATLDEMARLIQNGYSVDFVNRYVCKDGSFRYLSWHATFIAEEGITYSTARDITARKQAEEALRNSEELLKASQEIAHLGSWSLDLTENYLSWSDEVYRIFGLKPQEFGATYEAFLDYVHPEDRSLVANAYSASICDGKEGYEIEHRIIRKATGEVRFVHEKCTHIRSEDNQIIRSNGMVHDITERKKSEMALQESKDLLADIIELSPISMAIVGMDGTIEQINRRSIETFGYYPDDIPNLERWWILAYPDETYRAEVIAQWMGLVGKAIAEKSEIERHEYRVTCKDGTVRTTLIFGIPVSDKIFVMFDDITNLKRAEEERLSLERQLLQSQKLESLGVLAGGIAHDFNNILTSIVGNTDLALMRLNPESPVIDNLKRIEKSAVRATELAKQMLAYSGKGKFVVEAIDINRLVQEMGHMLEVSISKKVSLQYNLAQPLPSVEVDATQIRQVAMNLVINASEAIGERNGVITITTGCMNCDKDYLKNAILDNNIKAGSYVYLEIADTGCGMDKKTLSKVFDPFFTTKFTGRGLGMAAVQGIVRSHKGFFSFYSEPGKGTTFKVFLPASEKLILNLEDQTKKDNWRGKGKVLLVDDEETVRDIGTEMLQELGLAVITANDGNDAIEKFKASPDIAFVILDLTMPQMDGEECFRELKQLKSDLKVIISSGFSEQEVSQKFSGRGMAGFIQKPYNMSELKEAIQKI